MSAFRNISLCLNPDVTFLGPLVILIVILQYAAYYLKENAS